MNFSNNKLEYGVGGLVLVLLAGLFHLFGHLGNGSMTADEDVVYEMPRPKNFQGSDFDLSGREIDRAYINKFVKKLEFKANNEAKKQAEAAAAAAKKSAATNSQKQNAAKGKVSARTVNTPPTQTIFAGDVKFETAKKATPMYRNYNNIDNTAANDTTKNKSDKLSESQWLSLILSQPTKENMNKLIDARNKDEISSTAYNSIMVTLLKNSSSDIQDLGLYGAQTFPDASSFALVAENEELLKGSSQTQAQTFLMTYTQTSRLSALAQVLSSNEEVVLSKATEVVIAGYNQAKKGSSNVVSASARDGRGTASVANLDSYQKFVAIYQKLAQSTDQTIANLANTALSALA